MMARKRLISGSPPKSLSTPKGAFVYKEDDMSCCEVKYYGVYLDERGEPYLAPVDALYCPVCGTPIIPGN